MKLIVYTDERGAWFMIECPCGFATAYYPTVEGAGRDADLHMAEKFPIGTQRRPCNG